MATNPRALKEIESNLLFIDDNGNLVLSTKGKVAGQVQAGNTPQLVVPGTGGALTISSAAGATNVADVTFQVQDGSGRNVTGVYQFDIYLSDAATGAGLTATTATGGIAAAASGGAIIQVQTAAKALRVQTNASGAFVLAITDTGKTHFYPVGNFGPGGVTVGPQLTTGNYG